jgi:transcriptional regulator with XRE-family HTH domain
MAVTKQATPIDSGMRAAEMLAEGIGHTEIAETLGVSRMTIWRWLRNEDVTAYYVTLVNLRVAKLKNEAINYLRNALNDPDCPHAVKHAIARTILERCDKLERVRDRTLGNDNAEDDGANTDKPWQSAPYQIKRTNEPSK